MCRASWVVGLFLTGPGIWLRWRRNMCRFAAALVRARDRLQPGQWHLLSLERFRLCFHECLPRLPMGPSRGRRNRYGAMNSRWDILRR